MTKTPKVRLREVFKIFGAKSKQMMAHVHAGADKETLLAKHGHVLGLRNINVDMQAGEITVVMGLSGSGKSTLIRHINRLIEPTAGEILVDGQDVTALTQTELRDLRRRSMAMVFQKFALLPHQTVLQNTTMALRVQGHDLKEQETEARKWIARVGLGGYEHHYPSQLSGGMQQRVGIARALTAGTDIMLMDEAFSALDPLIRTDMQNLLLELQEELHKTIIFITHDLDEALKLADHLVILKDGEVIQQGDPQHILLNPQDPYIEEFVGDINRARVLRVNSIMEPLRQGRFHGEVQSSDTLEKLIAKSNGETSYCYKVLEGDTPVGVLDMTTLVRALVPRKPSASEPPVQISNVHSI
ncbi:betaine/proline/choline family ABC transporter ATP-binding protein [Leisingera sp. ANG59]|uniref:quaternary amine ABC transporter ATP-binding protein n=1 Tax=Leisingera sp. ANG59 TaxID=2675221 RepID=UPI001573CE7C|nr:betaine/proline/choline family ABC transporter ATP-binding protein [Leisingera sp. ANG59]